MKTQRQYPKEPANILDNDVVSGSFFRQFIAQYKEYDAKQKAVIEELQSEIRKLQQELRHAKAPVPKNEGEKDMKILEQRRQLICMSEKLHRLREHIKTLQK